MSALESRFIIVRGQHRTIAGPPPDSVVFLGYEAKAVPFGLEDPPLIVEGFVDKCREHRSISRIHVFSFGPGLV
jgi:hypothetical protein